MPSPAYHSNPFFDFDLSDSDTSAFGNPFDNRHVRFGEPKMDPWYSYGSFSHREPEFSMSTYRRELGELHLKKGYLHEAKQTRLKMMAKRHKKQPKPFVRKTKVRGIVIAR